jgi:hypothetical protein
MDTLFFYFELGINHVLDPNGYDHVLFMFALALPYLFKSFTRLLGLATAFTLAHCLSLALAAFNVMSVDAGLIEFLIPVTIALTAIHNLITIGSANQSYGIQLAATVFFGLIHGFGFSNYFRMIMSGETSKLTALTGFTLGIELAQIIVITSTLVATLLITLLAGERKALILRILSALVLVLSIKIAVGNWPF